MDLKDSSIIVTGAARGIGAAIAHALAEDGAKLTIADRDGDGAKRTAEDIRKKGGQAISFTADVCKRDQVVAMIDAAEAAFGPMYSMIANAGVVVVKPFLSTTEDEWRRVMEVNSLGCMITMQEAAKRLIKHARGGKIVTTASIAGRQGFDMFSAYCGSKFSVIALTQAAAKALGPHKINVNAICPGVVGTEMWKEIGREFHKQGMASSDSEAFENFSAGLVLGRSSVAEDLVGVARFLCSSGSDYVTGQAINVDGGMVFS